MNRRAEMTVLLETALKKPDGIILKITGGGPGKRQSALSALASLKRELTGDIPEMLDLSLKAVPGKEDEIAIVRLKS